MAQATLKRLEAHLREEGPVLISCDNGSFLVQSRFQMTNVLAHVHSAGRDLNVAIQGGVGGGLVGTGYVNYIGRAAERPATVASNPAGGV